MDADGAQSFLVLALTHSGTQLGLTTAARFLPVFLLGPMGGLIADRMDKQRVMYVTQTLSGVLAAAFAVLIATHSIRLWMVYALALALGCVNVFDNPARRVPRQGRQVRQGLAYVRSTPELIIPLVMIAVIGTLAWEFPVTLPLMARNVFHGGVAAYGLMASVMGIGAVAGDRPAEVR